MTDSDYYLDMEQFGPGLSLSKSCENSYLDHLIGAGDYPPTGAGAGAPTGAPYSNLNLFTPMESFDGEEYDSDELARIFFEPDFAPNPRKRRGAKGAAPKPKRRTSKGAKGAAPKPRTGKRSAHMTCPPRSALTAHPGLLTALRGRPRNAAGAPTFESKEARNALMEKWEWWVEKRANGPTKIQYYFHFPLAPGAKPGAKRVRALDSWAKVLKYLDV